MTWEGGPGGEAIFGEVFWLLNTKKVMFSEILLHPPQLFVPLRNLEEKQKLGVAAG